MDNKTCVSCKHCNGYRCKSEKVGELAGMVLGMNLTGADTDTFQMRTGESACGILGNWWESIESPQP